MFPALGVTRRSSPVSFTTCEAGWQEKCIQMEAELFLPHINPFFMVKDQKVSAAWSCTSLHCAVGRDAIQGPGGKHMMALSFTTSAALFEGRTFSQGDHTTAVPTQNGVLAAETGHLLCRATPARYELPALPAAHPSRETHPKHRSIFAPAKPSRFASYFAASSGEPVGRFPQQPGSALGGTRHPLDSRCPSKKR